METTLFDFFILVRAFVLTAILSWLGLSFDEQNRLESRESVVNAAVHSVLPF